jgi:hypothetical protein
MNSIPRRAAQVALLALLGLACVVIHSDATLTASRIVPHRIQTLPRITLWAWERSEDLRSIDPTTTAIAFLDRTIFIGSHLISRPRSNPLLYPTGTTRIAVVRIEVEPATPLTPSIEDQLLPILLRSAQRPNIAALQIDFDATRSQRPFYRRLLNDLRSQMPPALPLSITALASWCSYDNWLTTLPIDEAVPMLFRMEPDRHRINPDNPALRIREPLCKGSVGLSTHEPWPSEAGNRRIYLFPDRGWKTDLPLLASQLSAPEAPAISGHISKQKVNP